MPSTTVAASAATETTAIRARETTSAGEGAGAKEGEPAAAAPGYDQRRVTRTDDESTAATASKAIAAHADDGDLQRLPGGQAEIAANLRTATADTGTKTNNNAASSLRAKSEDLIGVRSWDREVDEGTGISEVKQRCSGGWLPRGEQYNRQPTQ
jgi:hypothetical protein